MTSPARFSTWTRPGDKRLPSFFLNHLKRTTSLYTGADGTLEKRKTRLCCGGLRTDSSRARWTSCTKSIFQKGLRSPNSKHRGMWKSSKVCRPSCSRRTAAASTQTHKTTPRKNAHGNHKQTRNILRHITLFLNHFVILFSRFCCHFSPTLMRHDSCVIVRKIPLAQAGAACDAHSDTS